MTQHKSDSSEQLHIEQQILSSIAARLNLHFDPAYRLAIGVQPDGIDPEKKVIVEVYAHVGRLKGAQLHKVKADLLKLTYIEAMLGPGWRKVICFCSSDAAAFLLGESWAAKAARIFGIEIIVEPITSEQELQIKRVQERQRMVNAP